MDHTHYTYSALPHRPREGHGASGVQASVVLFLEHWDAEPVPGTVRDPRFVGEFGSFSPDYRSWTQREHGLRVGVFRVLDALAEAGIVPAVAANARAVERLPALVERLNALGCEWLGHGHAATAMMHSGMPLAAQREHIESALAALQRCTGRRPAGWASQDWGTTPETFGLLARAGLRYTLDWCNDDQPYPLQTEPSLWALPLSAEWDDVQCQWLRHLEPRAHAALTLAAFDRLRAECTAEGRGAVFMLGLHPWVSGMASRIGALRALLRDLKSRPGVSWRLPGEIAQAHAAPEPHLRQAQTQEPHAGSPEFSPSPLAGVGLGRGGNAKTSALTPLSPHPSPARGEGGSSLPPARPER
jgi:peptidoglycan/xylan/chitin deacetylase (PgdA/CDA1 family)